MISTQYRSVFILLSLIAFLAADFTVFAGEEEKPDPMAKVKWQSAVMTFTKLRQSRKPQERVQAVKALALALMPGVHLDAAKLLVMLLKEEIARGKKKEEKVFPRVIERTVGLLRRLKEPKAEAWLLDVVKNPRFPWRVRFHVIEALGSGSGSKVIGALRGAALSDDPKIRIAAIDALAKIGNLASVDVFIKALSDPAWQVKVAAIHALGKMQLGSGGEKERAIEALIGALGSLTDEEGRLKFEIVSALKTITYEDLGFEATAWENWWARKKRGESGGPGAGHTRATVPEYHGLKIWSTRIVFVIDTTGSMADPASKSDPSKTPRKPIPLPPQVTGAAKTPVDKGLLEKLKQLKDKNDKREVKTKMDAEKRELINAILLLTPKVHFSIVTYAEVARPWRPHLVPATAQNKIAAVKMVEDLIPTGGTDIYKALVEAFQIHEKAGARKKKGPNVRGAPKMTGKGKYNPVENIAGPADEIFLLTDGRPTVGELQNPNRICEEIRKINKVRKIRINTIAVGTVGQGVTPVDPGFMRRLAEENDGKFVHVK
ncbi:MAG: HEAT repeat domain-containing protein [Planctomycetota bacterium]|jgi:hypothetical protein